MYRDKCPYGRKTESGIVCYEKSCPHAYVQSANSVFCHSDDNNAAWAPKEKRPPRDIEAPVL